MFNFNLNFSPARPTAELAGYKAKIYAAQSAIMQQTAPDIEAEIKQSTKGNLSKSVNAYTVRNGNQITIKAGDSEGRAPYGVYLEYGTVNMSARPWLMPAFAKYAARLEKSFAGLKGVL